MPLALSNSPAALLDFVDRYGAYATGYTAARDKVQRDVETAQRKSVDDRWQSLLQQLLESTPTGVVSEKPRR